MRNAEQRSEGACRAALARALAPSQIDRVLRAENDMRVSLVSAAILVAGAVACGGKEPTGGGTSPDVAGTWTYFETVSDAADGLSCSDQGTFDVAQAGAGFSATATQTGYCTGPGGVVDNSGTGSVSGFTSASTIQFDLAGCRYRGGLVATPPDSAAGSVSCSLTENNKTFTLTGTWFAVKGVDLAPPTAAGTDRKSTRLNSSH